MSQTIVNIVMVAIVVAVAVAVAVAVCYERNICRYLHNVGILAVASV
jgi:polyferredoxin